MVLASGEDRRLVFGFPAVDEALFALKAVDHEGRCAIGMDRIAALFGQKRNLLLIGAHDGFEFVAGAMADVGEEGQHADSLRQQADEFLKRTGAQGRMDDARDTAPSGKCHAFAPRSAAIRLDGERLEDVICRG